MPNEIYENIIENQNNFITARTAEINELKENTATALASLSALANRVYGYTHTAVVTDSLDALYNSIIAENNELAELSAVGFSAMLRSGDTIPVQGNRMFINGTETQTDYTFSGENSEDGTELVQVWCFEKNNSLILSDDIDFSIVLVHIIQKNTEPLLNSSYLNYVVDLNCEFFGSVGIPRGIKHCVIKNTGALFPENFLPSDCESVEIIYTDGISYRRLGTPSANCKKIVIDVEEISTSGDGFVSKQANAGQYSQLDVELILRNLKSITRNYSNEFAACFNNIKNIVIPETVERIGAGTGKCVICCNNDYIRLECRDAEYISPNWCANAPRRMFEMVDDWGASINIATSAANWSKADFIDLFQNKLHDMGEDAKEIKIPSAIFDSLTDEEFELAENKGWTIGC